MDAARFSGRGEIAPERTCTGVVLAGGGGRRMGADKAALVLGGEPLLRRVVARLRAALPRVLVVGPERMGALVPGVRVAPDRVPGAGPLGGLATALREIDTPYAFVVACDMPFIAPPLVRAMVALAADARPPVDAVLLRSDRGLEYLHAVYGVSCLPAVERLLSGEDRSLGRLARALDVRELAAEEARRDDPRGLSAFNANTPEEWALALALLEGEPADEG